MFHHTAELQLLDCQLSVVLVSLPKINQPITRNIKISLVNKLRNKHHVVVILMGQYYIAFYQCKFLSSFYFLYVIHHLFYRFTSIILATHLELLLYDTTSVTDKYQAVIWELKPVFTASYCSYSVVVAIHKQVDDRTADTDRKPRPSPCHYWY